jgi:hypothetical protein
VCGEGLHSGGWLRVARYKVNLQVTHSMTEDVPLFTEDIPRPTHDSWFFVLRRRSVKHGSGEEFIWL